MGMERKAALGALVFLVAAGAANAGCKELAAAIDSAEKSIALESTSGLLDTSAPRESMRQAKISNEIAAINADITLTISAKCPLPSAPIDTSGSGYLAAALECTLAIQKNGTASDEAKQACEQSRWKRK